MELDSEALLVDSAVMTSAQQHEVVELGGAAVGPVLDVVSVAKAQAAAGETAAVIAMDECPPQGDAVARQRLGVDVEYHLVAVAASSGSRPAANELSAIKPTGVGAQQLGGDVLGIPSGADGRGAATPMTRAARSARRSGREPNRLVWQGRSKRRLAGAERDAAQRP